MKLNRFLLSPSRTATTLWQSAMPLYTKFALLAALGLAFAGCASKDLTRPTGAPVSYSPEIRRDPGVINDPNNTGNDPADLSPYSVRWGDVRHY